MKKTIKTATIGQLNRTTGNYTHIERRIYEDEKGNEFVKINGIFIEIDFLILHDRTINVWF